MKSVSYQFQRGDHLYVDYGGFTHHGIYYGHGKVIHYLGDKVCKDSLKKFARGDIDKISVKSYHQCSNVEEVRARAKRKLGEKKYNLLISNCEHFATWCKTGKWRSKQVEQFHKTTVKYVGHHSHKAIRKVSKDTKKATLKARKVFKRLRLI